jgi:pSer/pThr/pTyr-binding forkhead associated (FHA) protein
VAAPNAEAGEPAADGAHPSHDAPFAPADPRFISQTMVFAAPIADAPAARLREVRPNGTQRDIDLDGAPLTIGRASDNGLVIHDSRVSRHHARLQARRGALVFTDLGSTNGSRVNGGRVSEVALGEGDRIEIGDTVLVVESVGGR